jgi:DNA repair protein RadC
MAELAVTYRRGNGKRQAIQGPVGVIRYLRQVWDNDTIELREDFYMLCLDGARRITGWIRLFSGGIGSCTIDPRIAFGVAVQTAAEAVLFAHNHPSGSTAPSEDDRKMAGRLNAGGELLGIRVLDHIILTEGGHNSYSDTNWR